MVFHFEHVYDLPRSEMEFAFACQELENLLDEIHGHGGHTTEEWTDDGEKFHRVFRYSAGGRLIKIIAGFLRKGSGEPVQLMEYDRRTHRGFYIVTPPALASRLTYRSDFTIEEREEGRSARVSDIELDVRIPAFGKLLSKRLIKEVERFGKLEYEGTVKWIEETWPAIKNDVISNWPPAVV